MTHKAVKNKWSTQNPSEQTDDQITSIIPLADVVYAKDVNVKQMVYLPCWDWNTNLTFNRLFQSEHQLDSDYQNCSVIFTSSRHQFSREIHIDAKYTFIRRSTQECVTGELQIDRRLHVDRMSSHRDDTGAAFTSASPRLMSTASDHTSTRDSSFVTKTHANRDATPAQGSEWGHENTTQRPILSLTSSLSAIKYKECKCELLSNYTMLSATDICVFSS